MEYLSNGNVPLLEELCIRVLDRRIDDIEDDNEQIKLLLQLPDELKIKIFSYFHDIGKVTDQVISLFLPTHSAELKFSEYIRLSDAALATVADKIGSQLTSLSLNGCVQLTDVGVIVIASSCPNLTNLNLAGCPMISALGIESLANKSSLLQELDVSDCPLIDDEAFYHLTRLPSIGILNLSECNRLQFDISPKASPRAEYWAALEKKSMRSLCLRGVVSLNDLALLRLVRMFPELRILDCSFCAGRITDRGVEAISLSTVASTLFSLNLWGANISDLAIDHLIRTCTGLRTLTIADCPNITETAMLLLISKMRGLKTLTMWGCSGISAVSVQLFLRYFPGISSLGLNHCSQIQNYAIKGLANCTTLRNIELEGCYSITDEGIADLGGDQVTSINFRGCTNLTAGSIQRVIERSPNVSALSLCRIPLDDSDSRSLIVSSSSLSRLSLSYSARLSDATLHNALELGLSTRLQTLKVDGCTNLSDEIIQSILGKCCNLQDLSANFCQQLSGKALLVTPHPQSRHVLPLKRLSLAGCLGISCSSVCELVRLCPKLTHLMVPLIGDLHDLLLSTLEKSCPALELLVASRSSRITAAGVRRLVSGCVGIKHLDLSQCDNLTDNGLIHISKLGNTLRHLDLSNCPMISSAAVLDLLIHTRDLQSLTIKASSQKLQFPSEFFVEATNLRPRLKIIKNY